MLLAVAGCGGGGGGTVATSVSGTILHAGTLEPLSGVRVATATSQEATTNNAGVFTLSNIGANAMNLTASKASFENLAISVPSGTGDKSVGTKYLRPAAKDGFGHVSGVVTRAGTPAAGAVITAASSQAISRADGSYILFNVPVGFQQVYAVSADNSVAGFAMVDVVNRTTITTGNIVLSNQPPPPPVF